MRRAWRSRAEEPNNSIYLQVFCCVTGFTSDFLSFIVVEHIRFFHAALQLWSMACHASFNSPLAYDLRTQIINYFLIYALNVFDIFLLWHCWLGNTKGKKPLGIVGARFLQAGHPVVKIARQQSPQRFFLDWPLGTRRNLKQSLESKQKQTVVVAVAVVSGKDEKTSLSFCCTMKYNVSTLLTA